MVMPHSEVPMRRVMWDWSVRAFSFEQQIEAAAAGHFDVFTVAPRKYRKALSEGRTAKELLAIAADKGVTLDFVDGMSSWAPIWFSPDADEFMKTALNFSIDDTLRICENLGLKHVIAVGMFDVDSVSLPALVDAFGSFCRRMAGHDISVELEPQPISGIRSLDLAWEIVRQADCVNGTLVIDTWHFMRSDPDFELLKSIPRNKITDVQLADALREMRGGSIWEDVFHYRMLPGEGELPIVEILQLLRERHDLRHIGPEILSDELDKLTPTEVGLACARTTDAVMKAAGFSVP